MRTTGRRRGVKSWLVEPYRQVKLGLMFLVVNLIFSALIFSVFGYLIWDIYNAVSTYFALSGAQSALALSKFAVPAAVGAALILLFIVTTLLISVKYTHEIYGPLVSINRFLDDLLEGKRPDLIALRESDQLKDLAERLNSLAERLIGDQRQAPMIAIHRFLDDYLAGKTPAAIQLRGSDHLSQLAEKLNMLAAKK